MRHNPFPAKNKLFRFVALWLLVCSMALTPTLMLATAPAHSVPALTVPAHVLVVSTDDMGVMYSLISNISGSCYVDNGKVHMGGQVVAQGMSADYSKVTIALQKDSGSGWKADGSWSATGTGYATKMQSKDATANCLYRLKITGLVRVGSAEESDTIYTLPCAS